MAHSDLDGFCPPTLTTTTTHPTIAHLKPLKFLRISKLQIPEPRQPRLTPFYGIIADTLRQNRDKCHHRLGAFYRTKEAVSRYKDSSLNDNSLDVHSYKNSSLKDNSLDVHSYKNSSLNGNSFNVLCYKDCSLNDKNYLNVQFLQRLFLERQFL